MISTVTHVSSRQEQMGTWLLLRELWRTCLLLVLRFISFFHAQLVNLCDDADHPPKLQPPFVSRHCSSYSSIHCVGDTLKVIDKKVLTPTHVGKGIVYAFKIANSPVVKIGYSEHDDAGRVNEVCKACKVVCEKTYQTPSFAGAFWTEQILHKLMQPWARLKVQCSCHVVNHEWVEQDFDLVVAQIHLVHTWMKEKPFGLGTNPKSLTIDWKEALNFWKENQATSAPYVWADFFLHGLSLMERRTLSPKAILAQRRANGRSVSESFVATPKTTRIRSPAGSNSRPQGPQHSVSLPTGTHERATPNTTPTGAGSRPLRKRTRSRQENNTDFDDLTPSTPQSCTFTEYLDPPAQRPSEQLMEYKETPGSSNTTFLDASESHKKTSNVPPLEKLSENEAETFPSPKVEVESSYRPKKKPKNRYRAPTFEESPDVRKQTPTPPSKNSESSRGPDDQSPPQLTRQRTQDPQDPSSEATDAQASKNTALQSSQRLSIPGAWAEDSVINEYRHGRAQQPTHLPATLPEMKTFGTHLDGLDASGFAFISSAGDDLDNPFRIVRRKG